MLCTRSWCDGVKIACRDRDIKAEYVKMHLKERSEERSQERRGEERMRKLA